MKRILVTGISGFLGWHFIKHTPASWDLNGLYHQSPILKGDGRFWQVDLGNVTYTQEVLDQIKPDAIIHLAAISRPAEVEQQPDLSYRINVVIPSLLAVYASERNLPFVFTSTDLVFNGEQGNYSFLDFPQPINLYGKQKYEAERRVLEIHPASTVVRVPLLYGLAPYGKNFLQDWAVRLSQGQSIQAFSDEYRSTAYAGDIALGILSLLESRNVGIWHLGGPERLSRYEMGLKLAQFLEVPESLIVPSLQKELNLQPARPADVSLDSQKNNSFGYQPMTMEEGLQGIRSEFKKYLKRVLNKA